MRKGFTILELLVVIAIIGLLSGVVMIALGDARQKARDSERLGDIKALETALELYRAQNNTYPSTEGMCGNNWCGGCYPSGQFETALAGLVSGGHIKQIPNDPRPTSADCFSYEYYSRPAQSTGWTCGGQSIANNQYAIRFSLEKQKLFLPLFMWQRNGFNEYCLVK